MLFDAVHDTQRIFRKLLRAHSFPGAIVDVGPDTQGVETWAGISAAMTGIALTLLDSETSFCLWPGRAAAEKDFLSHLTYGRIVRAQEAAFHFVVGGEEAAAALRSAGTGTLVEPHRGATVIIEVDALEEEGSWVLRGPGIRTATKLGVNGFDHELLRLRTEKCSEYPLGIDLVLVDRQGRCAAIPRTTVVQGDA